MPWPAGWRSATAWRSCSATATRRLAGHFSACRRASRAVPARRRRIVILSPGPASPSYFSHAYLARYLGYTVVESGDLTVRDNQVYLKTLDGLQRVYLVVAKQPGHLMDPLHLPGTGSPASRAWSRPRGAAPSPWSTGLAAAWSKSTPWRRSPPDCSACSARNRSGRRAHTLAGHARPAAAALGSPSAGHDRGHRPQRSRRAVADPRPRPTSTHRAPQAGGAPRRRSASLGRGRAGHARDHALLRRRALRADAFALRAYVVANETGYRIMPGGMVRLAGAPTPRPCPTASAARTCGSPRASRARRAQHPAHQHARGPSAPHRPRPAEPHRRQSVLAGPLRRAGRGHHAAAAQRAVAVPGGRAARQQPGGPAAAAALQLQTGPRRPEPPRPAGTAWRSWSAS